MCGRYTITINVDQIRTELGIIQMPDGYAPRFNVAPSQPVAVVLSAEERKASWLKWGLIPFWAKDASIASKLINARSETVTEKPAFKNAFLKRRCLLLADGFYEWKRGGGEKGRSQPFYIKRQDSKPFAFAGLWEHWRSPEGTEVHTCTILTCEANPLVKSVHDRMPVILDGDRMWAWLSEGNPKAHFQLLQPYNDQVLTMYPVSMMVNRPDLDRPDLISPIQI